jgi:hypothetical protein
MSKEVSRKIRRTGGRCKGTCPMSICNEHLRDCGRISYIGYSHDGVFSQKGKCRKWKRELHSSRGWRTAREYHGR